MDRFASKSARLMLATLVLTSCIGCDQVAKRFATDRLRDLPAQSYFAGMVRFEYAQNPGGFLSVGDGLSPKARFVLFTLGNSTFLVAIACLVVRCWKMRLSLYVSLLLLLAGGVGNLLDRVMHQGMVTDFLVLGIWPLQTGIINFADIALTAGGLISALFYRRANA